MATHRFFFRCALLVLGACLAALPASAARRNDDPLWLVPADAAAVGVVHWNELRESPLGAKLLSETDNVTADGDAARFMAEARLNPAQDVDSIVMAGSPGSSKQGPSSGLVLFTGRFDTARLSAALAARGGRLKDAAGGAYYLLPEKSSDGHGRPGSIAFTSAHLVIAGDEDSVVAALARLNGGGADFASRTALGREYSRIDPGASAWALVDVKRFPAGQRADVNASGQAGELLGAMKSVSVVALQATVRADALDLSAAGIAENDETRQLIEDSIRGVVAMWRLAVQEKSPEAVAMLRRFKIGSDGQAVTIKGTLTGDYLRSLSEKRAGR
ncbi:MAG: hypothetical protein ACRD00_01320 [Thermoanaerobaculia bacterium]